ncbi:glycosyl transferase family 2 [Micromonospora pisi]|uniref:Glycosyl transferase family 2 n=1 Tax=Micromonospora pisi TaxID=589240 RepID=A0A495JWQ2_9ACTN|nr:glycosyltransferase family 2 protein [Micromonospora pisi]RKR92782.1 glycosyl transferase family 2 [Micromonospora pisi]
MAVFGISMVRDEADVVEGTLRHMADEVDHLIVADNGSTDGTRDILDRLARELPLTVVDDPEPAYYQSRKMTALADQAAALRPGETWIVPFDADELWTAEADRIRLVLPELDRPVAQAALTNHFCTSVDPDPAGSDPFRTMVWRQREATRLPKVAFRWEPGAVIHQGNHGVTLPSGGRAAPVLQVRHFPYRSADQFVRKAVNGAEAYRRTDLPADQGAHWRAYGEIAERHGVEALADVFRQHFWYLSPTDSGMVHDPAAYLRWRQ